MYSGVSRCAVMGPRPCGGRRAPAAPRAASPSTSTRRPPRGGPSPERERDRSRMAIASIDLGGDRHRHTLPVTRDAPRVAGGGWRRQAGAAGVRQARARGRSGEPRVSSTSPISYYGSELRVAHWRNVRQPLHSTPVDDALHTTLARAGKQSATVALVGTAFPRSIGREKHW